ncbi:MAG: pitrilysin family protein [bacterium]
MKEIEIKGIDEIIYHDVCDNGLNIYVWVNEKVESSFLSLAVKYGSIHTDFEIGKKKYKVPDGIAHYLEHVKFNEGPDKTAHDFFYKMGSEVNAFTTFDYTSYYVVTMDRVEENLIHLLDFVQTPYFTDELIEKEKGIICEEEKMGEDCADTVNYFGIFKNLFENSKYKDLVTGSLEEINKTTKEDIELVFNTFYHPENMALFITGNVNPHEIKMIVNKNQNSKKFKKNVNPKIIAPKEKDVVCKEYTSINGNVMQPRVKIGIKMPKEIFGKYTDFDIRFAINLALNMNFGPTSDIKEYLVENNIASNVAASCDIYDDHVIIVIASETRFPDDVIKKLEEKIQNMEYDEATFNRKIKSLIATFILNYDSIEKVNSIIQDDYINYGYVVEDAKEKYEKFTLRKFKTIMSLLSFENRTIFIMKPKEDE